MCRGISRAATAWRRVTIIIIIIFSFVPLLLLFFANASPQVNNNSPTRVASF